VNWMIKGSSRMDPTPSDRTNGSRPLMYTPEKGRPDGRGVTQEEVEVDLDSHSYKRGSGGRRGGVNLCKRKTLVLRQRWTEKKRGFRREKKSQGGLGRKKARNG